VARSMNAGMERDPYRAIGNMFQPKVCMPREESPPNLLVNLEWWKLQPASLKTQFYS
jgi:hypothetical protein